MRILVFAGAGTSVELGVPAMAGLAAEFQSHVHQWNVEPDMVKLMMANHSDVERLIEELDLVCSARNSLKTLGHDTVKIERAAKVRAEVEWFVQHIAERVVARDAHLMWGAVLSATERHEITFVTTNYDRSIEIAANRERVNLSDGFSAFSEGEMAPWIGFNNSAGRSRLVKLHGSTDWIVDKDTSLPTKLRHPIPLFGRSILQIDGRRFSSRLVLPSREKLLNESPYPRLTQAFLNESDQCDMALFVGSSLRDNHILEAARTIDSRASVFIVDPDEKDHGVPNAISIPEHASMFLMSTLSNALFRSDPVEALVDWSKKRTVVGPSILSWSKCLLDNGADTKTRCESVDRIVESGATLTPTQICGLIADGDPTVSRYALGLIPLSPCKTSLLDVAGQGCEQDSKYSEELDLLRRVVS